MAAKVTPGPVRDDACIKEAVCIHTKKIYDSCKDKDCAEEIRVCPVMCSKPIIESAVSVRPRSAELLFAKPDVEPVSFNRGYYTVDVRFFYKVKGEAYTPDGRNVPVTGLAILDKRVILFGSEGNAKIFTSKTVVGGVDRHAIESTNLPTAVVEAVDPIVLDMKLVDVASAAGGEVFDVPEVVTACFEDVIVLDCSTRRWYATLGQFTIIRLERDSQLLIPAYDYCIPTKECENTNDDPCTLFSRINFPCDEFFPPDTVPCSEDYRDALGTKSR